MSGRPSWPDDVRPGPGPRPPHPHQSVAVVARWLAAGVVAAVVLLWQETTATRLLIGIGVAVGAGWYGLRRSDAVSDSSRWQSRHR